MDRGGGPGAPRGRVLSLLAVSLLLPAALPAPHPPAAVPTTPPVARLRLDPWAPQPTASASSSAIPGWGSASSWAGYGALEDEPAWPRRQRRPALYVNQSVVARTARTTGAKPPLQPTSEMGTRLVAAGQQMVAGGLTGAAAVAALEALAVQEWSGTLRDTSEALEARALSAWVFGLAGAAVRNLTAVELSRAIDALVSLNGRHPVFAAHLSRRFSFLPIRLLQHAAYGDLLAGLPGPSLARLVWAVARLRKKRNRIVSLIRDRLLRPGVLGTLEARHVCMLLYGLAVISFNDKTLLRGVARHLRPGRLAGFAGRELATVAWAYARLGVRPRRLLRDVAAQVMAEATLPTLQARDITNVAWAFTTLRHRHPALFAALADRVLDGSALWRFNALSLSTLCWAYAKLGERHPALEAAMVQQAAQPDFVATFASADVARVAYAFAAWELRQTRPLMALSRRVALPDFLAATSPADLTSILWSFATLRFRARPMLRAVVVRLHEEGFLPRYSAREAVTLAWALATLRVRDDALATALSAHLCSEGRLAACKLQHLSTLLWAFAALRASDRRLPVAVAERLPPLVAAIDPPRLSTISAALAALAVRPLPLLQAMARRMAQSGLGGPGWDLARVATVAWAYAKLNVSDAALRGAVLAALPAGPAPLANATAATVARLAEAFGPAGWGAAPVLEAVAARCAEPDFQAAMGPSEFAATAGALAAADLPRHQPLLRTLLATAADRGLLPRLPPAAVVNLLPVLADLPAHSADEAALLAEPLARHLPRLPAAHVAAIARAAAALGLRDSPLPAALLRRTRRPGFGAQCTWADVGRLAWAFKRLGLPGRPTIPRLLEALPRTYVPTLPAAEMVDIAEGFAEWDLKVDRVVGPLRLWAAQEAASLSALRLTQLSRLLWAFSSLKVPSPEVLAAAASAVGRADVAAELTPHQTSDTLWAFARLGPPGNAALAALVAALLAPVALAQLNPPTLANAAWALGRLQAAPAALQALSAHALQSNFVPAATPRDLTNLLWAHATLGVRDEPLLAAATSRLAHRAALRAFTAGDLAFVAWSLAELGWRDAALMEALATELLQPDRLARCNRQALADLLWAFAALDLRHEKLFSAIVRRLLQRGGLAKFNGATLARAAGALARLGVRPDALVRAVHECVADPAFLAACPTGVLAELRAALPALGLPEAVVGPLLDRRRAARPGLAGAAGDAVGPQSRRG